jgi:hypothetical protein
MAEGIYVLSVAQLEFSVLGYCVSSFTGGQNFGTALWSHLQGSKRPTAVFGHRRNVPEEQRTKQWLNGR